MGKKHSLQIAIAFLIFFVLAGILPVNRPVHAQAFNAYDLIAAVNDLRSQYGLAPYQVDGSLMDYAQMHAAYMASIGSVTHIRGDGSRPRDLGLLENIAMGNNYSPSDVIFTLWTDEAHWNNLVGVSGGYIGAGVAQQGNFIYYAMDVRKDTSIAGAVPVAQQQSTPNATQPAASALGDVLTSTPNPDGSVVHSVKFGDSLWSIAVAYNMKINDILTMNGLPTQSGIQVGQNLIMRMANTETPTPTITPTNRPVTRTPTLTSTPRAPTATRTPAPTLTPTQKPLLPQIELAPRTKQWLGLSMTIICAAGLIFVIITAFLKKQ